MGNPRHPALCVERLERRILRALLAPDPTFNVTDDAVDGQYIVAPLAGGKVYVIGITHLPPDSGTDTDPGPGSDFISSWVLNPDGSVDSFNRVMGPNYYGEPTRFVFNGSQLYVSAAQDDNFPGTVETDELSAYTTDNQIDASFGKNGFSATPFHDVQGDDDHSHYIVAANLIGITPAGGLVSRADVEHDEGGSGLPLYPQLVQLKPDGSVDTSFGNQGFVDLPDADSRFMVTSNGLLKLTQRSETQTQVTRYAADGITVDTSFGNQGTLAVTSGAATRLDLHEAPDGKLIAVFNHNGENATFSSKFQRLNADGSTDSTFNVGAAISFASDSIFGVQFDNQGRITIGTQRGFYRYSNTGTLGAFPFDGATPVGGLAAAQFYVDDNDRIVVGSYGSVERLTTIDGPLLGNDHILYISGSGAADTVLIDQTGNTIDVTVDSQVSQFDAATVAGIHIDLFAGDDTTTNNTSTQTTIEGGDGNDTIYGGSGADRLDGGVGNDSLWGNDGNDRIAGDEGHDYLYGGGNSDKIYGGLQPDLIRGNAGRDKLYGNGGSDRIYGGASADSIYGQGGNDQLFGEGGNDRLYADYDSGRSTLHGGAGDDQLITVNGLVDQLFGDGGHDSATADDIDQLTSIEATP